MASHFGKLPLMLKRYLYHGALNGPQIKFVPVSKSRRPSFFTKSGVNERIFRARMKLQTIVGLYQLWKLIPHFGLSNLGNLLVNVYERFLSAVERLQSISGEMISFCSNNKEEVLEYATLRVYESLKGKKIEGCVAAATRRFMLPPKLINVVPIQVQGTQGFRIFQVTLFLQPESVSQAPGAYIVFEYCPDVFSPRWRVCGQIHESDEYY